MEKLLLRFIKSNWLLILICLFGLGLRVYKVKNNPPSLNWDEVSHGYNAYSILKTGKDEWGKSFPLIFRAYGDYKLPVYIYLSTLPIKIFGMNALGVRLISVFSGTGLIIVSYFLAKKLTRSELGGLTAAFLTALTPWSLFLSRIAVEANLAAFLFSFGWLMFFENQFILTAVFWGLSLHTYNSARVLVPLTSLILIGKLFRKKKFRQLAVVFLILGVSLVPIGWQFWQESGQARFYWVNIVDQGVVNQINERRGNSNLPYFAKRLFFNRPTYFLTTAAKNYLNHFSLNWLFLKGGKNYQFSFPDHGLINLVAGPFLLVGLFFLFRKMKWLWLIWLVISFIPSAITKDSPHVLRSILILPLPMIFSSYGLIKVKNWLKPKSKFKGGVLVVVFILVNLVTFGLWWKQYWQIYRPNYSWSWQYGYQQAVEVVKENYSHYDQIIFSKAYGEPHEFILFYWPWKPSYYQDLPDKKWDYHAHWYWVDAFDKFRFWNNWEIKEQLKAKSEKLEDNGKTEKILLVTKPGNFIQGGEIIKEIDFLGGGSAFNIVKYEF